MSLFEVPTAAKRSAPLPASIPTPPPVVAAQATDTELPAGPRTAQYFENLVISSVLSASGLSVKESKPALSLQQTTIQFRRCVSLARALAGFCVGLVRRRALCSRLYASGRLNHDLQLRREGRARLPLPGRG